MVSSVKYISGTLTVGQVKNFNFNTGISL